ncbi:methyl-accepting chemotaxis protein [Rheinheimera texasensis]|uniref:methyl-accepting chemotaxis protein n=1 Tax=Rheinheimera texasensis TaxID=306205 RepID=UPI0004E26105|nr:methyl-accepting chemotaxis protein [Rheinheimera texasensis]
MKHLLQNLPMHRKLLLLLFFPSVLLLWFATQSLLAQWQQYQNAVQVRAAISDHLLLGQLVNALQVERGSSGIFISSKGARFGAEVKKARNGSDERLAALTGLQRAELNDLMQALPGLRVQIDSFNLDATAAAAAYTKHISQLLQRNDAVVQTLTDLTLARQLATLNDWIELIERAGRERAMVSLAFSQDQAEPALISRIAQNQGAFLVFSSRLQQSADDKALLQQADSAEYLALQPLVLQSASGQKFGQDAANWFSVASKRMAMLISRQQQLMQQIGDAAASQQAAARGSLLQAAILLLLAVLVVAGFSLAIHRNIQQAMRQIRRLMQQLTGRDLTARSQYQGQDEFGQIAAGMNQLAEELQQVMREIYFATQQVATAAEQASAVTRETSAGVAQQQQDTEMAATAMHEMSATVHDVALSTAAAAEQAQEVQQKAGQGQQQLSQTITLIQQLRGQVQHTSQEILALNEHSQTITQVLDVIRGIADQTNLLALNAAIEAARAGEQGRGFAVVADEVRHLAQRTQQSTVDIQKMIETLQQGAAAANQAMQQSLQQADRGAAVIQTTGELLADVVHGVAAINDKTVQIASAAEEQSTVAEQINENITRISDISQHTSSGAEETAVTAAELAKLAEQLQAMINRFRLAA